MKILFYIGTGGCLGAISRYLLSGYVQQWSRSSSFPYGTLAVNLLGCGCIGFLSYLAEQRGILSSEMRGFLIVGILGGFTTFSTFANESMNMARVGEFTFSLLNIGAHVLFGLFAVWCGRNLAYLMWR